MPAFERVKKWSFRPCCDSLTLILGGESAMSDARVVRPDRQQLRWDMVDLEGLLPADHRARIVWSFVESLDLSELYEGIRSREGEAGRPARRSRGSAFAVALCDG